MIGVPFANNIGFLIGFFSHFGDNGILSYARKKSVDIDIAPALGKCDVLFLGEGLIAKEYHAIIRKGPIDLSELFIVETRCNVNVPNFSAECPR